MTQTLTSSILAVPGGKRSTSEHLSADIRTTRIGEMHNVNTAAGTSIEKESYANNDHIEKKNVQRKASVSDLLSRLTTPTASSRAKMRDSPKSRDPSKLRDSPKLRDSQRFQYLHINTKTRDERVVSSPSTLRSGQLPGKSQDLNPPNLRISRPVPIKVVPGSWNHRANDTAVNVRRKAPSPPLPNSNQISAKSNVTNRPKSQEIFGPAISKINHPNHHSNRNVINSTISSTKSQQHRVSSPQRESFTGSTYPSPNSISSPKFTEPSQHATPTNQDCDNLQPPYSPRRKDTCGAVGLSKPIFGHQRRLSAPAPSFTTSPRAMSREMSKMAKLRDLSPRIGTLSQQASGPQTSEPLLTLNESLRIRNRHLKSRLDEALVENDQIAAELATSRASRDTFQQQVKGHEVLHEDMQRKHLSSQKQLQRALKLCTMLNANVQELKTSLEESQLELLKLKRKLRNEGSPCSVSSTPTIASSFQLENNHSV